MSFIIYKLNILNVAYLQDPIEHLLHAVQILGIPALDEESLHPQLLANETRFAARCQHRSCTIVRGNGSAQCDPAEAVHVIANSRTLHATNLRVDQYLP